jgi:hypothetical protein
MADNQIKYSLIILPSSELKKLNLKDLNWQYMSHLDSYDSEDDFNSFVVEEIRSYTNLKNNQKEI